MSTSLSEIPQQSRTSAAPRAWHTAVWLIGLLPALLAVATWDSDGKLTHSGYLVRHLSWPVTVAELVVILIALRVGFVPSAIWNNFSRLIKALMAIWLLAAMMPALIKPDQGAMIVFFTLRYLVHGIFFAALLHIRDKCRYPADDTVSTALSTGAIAYIGILSLFAVALPNPVDFPWTNRLPSATNIRQIGYYVAIMAVAPLTIILFHKHNRTWLASLSFATLIAFVAWSGSRASLLGLILGCALPLALFWRALDRKRMLLAFACLSVGLSVSVAIPTPSPAFGLVRMVEATDTEDASSGRTYVWSKTVEELSTQPFVGHGAGTFRAEIGAKYKLTLNHPHQLVLQYIYDWGLIGGIAALLLIVVFGFKALSISRKAAEPKSAFLGLASFTTIIVISMIDGALFSPLSIVLTLVALAPMMAGERNSR